MNLKTDIQQLNNRIDTCRRKLDAAKNRADSEMVSKFTDELEALTKRLNSVKSKQDYDLNKMRKTIADMPFSRELTKLEQADLGKLKNR